MIYIYNLDMSLHILMRAESFDFIFDHAHNCLSMKRNNVVGKIVLSKKQTSSAFVQILTLTAKFIGFFLLVMALVYFMRQCSLSS